MGGVCLPHRCQLHHHQQQQSGRIRFLRGQSCRTLRGRANDTLMLLLAPLQLQSQGYGGQQKRHGSVKCYVQGTNAAEVCLCCCLKKEDKRRVRKRLGELGHFVQTFFWTSTLYLTPSSHLQWPCALAWAVIEMCKLKLEPCVARSGSVTSLLLFNPFKPNPPSTCVLTAVSHCSVSDEGHC